MSLSSRLTGPAATLVLALAYLAVGVALVFGAGCAGRTSPEYRVAMRRMEPQGLHDGAQGRLWFEPRICQERALARHVCAHELGHAVGADHVAGRGRIMSPSHSAGEAPITRLSPEEVRSAKPLAVPVKVRVPKDAPPRVVDGLRWGANLWNRALPKPAIELCPGGT